MGVLRRGLELLFPRRCILCRGMLPKEQIILCASCRCSAPEYPSLPLNSGKKGKNSRQFLDSFAAVWYYDRDVRRSLHRFKFRGAAYLAPKYAVLLAQLLRQCGPEEFDILTWVPVSRRRRFHRGYDQCELLARALGRELGIHCQRTLYKHRHTPAQSGLSGFEARAANVLGAFRVCGGEALRGKRVVLVDDIRTTGATLNECARMLLTAGAKEVHAVAVAATYDKK